MTFHDPHLLWLLAPLLLLFSWELARRVAQAAQRWPKITRAWAGTRSLSLGTRHSTVETRPRIWLWFGLACCIVALARPQWGEKQERIFDQSREVLIAVDLSRSMLAPDVKPSRLERAKLLVQSLLDNLRGERVGLVLFAGTAFLQSPLSADYEILREFLPNLQPDYLPEGGSNYQAMLQTSIDAFGTSAADRYLIVLSDGESTEDGWQQMTDTLKTKGIRVIGLGLGTAEGAFIPAADGSYVKDERGAVVLSKLNDSTLRELARTTGGTYMNAANWVDLPALLRDTVARGRQGEFSETETTHRLERYQWFLAPGLLLLLLSFWIEFPVRPRERSLPLPRPAGTSPRNFGPAHVASLVLTLLGLAGLLRPSVARATETIEGIYTKPVITTVTRLSAQTSLSAKDYAELAQTTLTYGQRQQGAKQPLSEGIIRDGLAAVSLGEKLDTKAADWPKLRSELETLLKKPEQPPKQDEKKDEQKNEDKKDQDQQKQSSDNQSEKNQSSSDQKNSDSKSDSQPQSSPQSDKSDSNEKQKSESPSSSSPDQPNNQSQSGEDQPSAAPQPKNESAFGKFDNATPPPPKDDTPPPSQRAMQTVGGQPNQTPRESNDPALAIPLQKLDQVKDHDAPARLQQLMQGPAQQPAARGKDW